MTKMAEYRRIALIGLDGSGKSANINKMKKDIAYREYSFVWVRWQPKLLRPIYWLLEKKIKNSKENFTEMFQKCQVQKLSNEQKKLNEEYNKKSGIKEKIFKNPIIRRVWMALALIDYFFQFYYKTAIFLIKKDKIIFDRFYLDLFVDQGINFGYTPEKINKEVKKYQWLFPKMDKIIYLRVSPKACYNRKDDIPNMEYLFKRYEVYERLCKNPGWVIIDGESSFEKVNNNIKREIFNSM